MTNNYIFYLLNVIFFQYLPAIIVDALLLIFGQKPFLLKIQHKIFTSMEILSVFINNQWYWDNRQLRLLYKNLSPSDQHIFDFDAYKIDYRVFMANWILGARRFLLKLDDSTIEASKRLLRKLYWLHLATRTIFGGLLIWFTYRILSTMFGDTLTTTYECETCNNLNIFPTNN